jgi:hypothetical protein
VLTFLRKHYATLVFSVGVMCMFVSWHQSREAWDAARAAQSQADAADKAVMRMAKVMEWTEAEATRAAANAKDARKSADIVSAAAYKVGDYIDKLTHGLAVMRADASIQTAEIKPPRPTVGPNGGPLE